MIGKEFAKIDDNNIVEQVIVAEQDFIDTLDGSWIETSEGLIKQTAGVGMTYDKDKDIFVLPKPFDSWTLDTNSDWQPPKVMPADGPKSYYWDEETQDWINYKDTPQ